MNMQSNLSKVVFRRTYTRSDFGQPERFLETVDRVIEGNVRGFNVPEAEVKALRRILSERKGGPAGRGWWFSGAPAQRRIGGAALNNCWFTTSEDWWNFVMAQDLLMLGGGVGMSVEHRFTSKLPRVKSCDIVIEHKFTKDADFIVPDSREGWNELLRRTLEAYFVTGKGFTYSTVVIRGANETIHGFGGKASGPGPLISMISKISELLRTRQGKHIRPIDAADLLCAIAEMVVAGNVRRSALIVIGDPWDKEFLKVKRWDLGILPSQRGQANFTVNADDIDDLHPLFWESYSIGEPIGLMNRRNIKKYARMGEEKYDPADGVNPCAEATLEGGKKFAEPCNLQEIPLPNLDSVEEFEEVARLMHRWGKRVTCANYHIPGVDKIIKKNRRVGTGITGCLQAPQFFNADVLDRVYGAIQQENRAYSAELGIPESIRTTVIKPSGTMSKVFDCYEGIHAAYSRYMIQRIQFAANDPMIPLLRAAGHHMEPQIKIDGSINPATLVVDFYVKAPDGFPVADEDWTTWKQLDVVKFAQKHWSDQSVSVTVYYRREEIPALKEWLRENFRYLKTISFLCHSEHGFKQAPKEAITKEQYERLAAKVQPVDVDEVGDGEMVEGGECAGGACPVR